MKNVILFNYNLDVQNFMVVGEDYSFYIDYEKFYMMKVRRPKEDIEEIKKIVNNFPKDFHKIVINRFASIYTSFEGSEYVLLKLSTPEHNEVDLKEIIANQKEYEAVSSPINRTMWNKLWEEKVDYLEYQVSELATPHKIISGSFSYYVGLAENAIEYFNMLNPKEAKTYVSRRRLKSPEYTLEYYNPLNLVIDYRVRDIAGYLKAEFFNRDDVMREIDIMVDKSILTPLEYNLLFCRLLYPSYYFDAMQKVLETNKNENDLLKYIEKVDDYEKFLNEVYKKFSSKCSMIKIDWLIKTS